ncbi:MAG: lamin tail domain-containing protein, partial [Gaiellaceae bacterium]
TVAAGEVGTATVTIELGDDGGIANGGVNTSPSQSFDITVLTPIIVISELRTRGALGGGSSDDFVELYNAGTAAIDISGWQVDAIDGTPETVTISGGTVLGAGQHYLIAHATGYSGSVAADQTFADVIDSDATITVKTAGGTPIDQVGLGSQPGEGTSLPTMTAFLEQSYERRIGLAVGNCKDTGDNVSDFLHNYGLSRPQNHATSPAVACGVTPTPATHATISEFRSTGPGGLADEFFEILNPTGAPIDISGWILDWKGSTLHTFTGGTVLAPGQRYVVAAPGGEYTGPSDDVYNGAVAWPYTGSFGSSVSLQTAASAVVDLVGWESGTAEGTALPSYLPLAFANRSYERRHGGCVDVDDNLLDFTASFTPTPGAGTC